VIPTSPKLITIVHIVALQTTNLVRRAGLLLGALMIDTFEFIVERRNPKNLDLALSDQPLPPIALLQAGLRTQSYNGDSYRISGVQYSRLVGGALMSGYVAARNTPKCKEEEPPEMTGRLRDNLAGSRYDLNYVGSEVACRFQDLLDL
jgi:hypothetical protein